MDVRTGHLVSAISHLADLERDNYVPVPYHLRKQAERELAGEDSVVVNLNKKTNLAKWARRKRSKSRVKNKLSKASRQKNRG